jgi:hypothetical protein
MGVNNPNLANQNLYTKPVKQFNTISTSQTNNGLSNTGGGASSN